METFTYNLSKDKYHYLPYIQYYKHVGLFDGLLLYIKTINLYLSNAYINRLTSSFTTNLINFKKPS